MDDARVSVAMLGLLSALDGGFKARAADKRYKRHHLLGLYEWVVERRFTVEELDRWVDASTCRFR
jgi:hypothetical protein